MFLRCVAIGVLLAVSSCELLSGDEELKQAKVVHQLHSLQNALEKYLEDQPAHAVTPPDTSESSENEVGHPVDTSTEGQDAQHFSSATTTGSIVAVVDSLFLSSTEGEEIDPEARNEAMHRERLVRTAINTSLVANEKIDMIQPTTEERERIRLGLIATNCSRMDTADAKTTGEVIGVDHLIWARIENDGEDVTIVAQRADNGVVVFEQTLFGWGIFKALPVPDEE